MLPSYLLQQRGPWPRTSPGEIGDSGLVPWRLLARFCSSRDHWLLSAPEGVSVFGLLLQRLLAWVLAHGGYSLGPVPKEVVGSGVSSRSLAWACSGRDYWLGPAPAKVLDIYLKEEDILVAYKTS